MLIQATPAILPHFLPSSSTYSINSKIPNLSPISFLSPREPSRICAKIFRCNARRRVRYEDEEDDEDYGHNEDIALLEAYTESKRSLVLLVKADVGGEQEEVIIFKGFSSRLSGSTASDPSKSVLPEKAIIESIDIIKGPFDPTNIEYLEKNLKWEIFKSRFNSI